MAAKDLVVEVDFVNEHVLLAAGIVSREHRRDLVKRVPASAERLHSPNTPTNICVGQWRLPFFG